MNLVELALSYHSNTQTINTLRNTDGLVPSAEITYTKVRQSIQLNLRHFPEIEVFPNSFSDKVVELLVNDPSLWKGCALDVQAMPSIQGRVTIFGVRLKKSLNECMKKGLQKSRYYLPDHSYDHNMGIKADLILFVGKDRNLHPISGRFRYGNQFHNQVRFFILTHVYQQKEMRYII